MKRKTTRLMLAAALLASFSILSGCQDKTDGNEKTAYEYGMELATTAAEMAKNENYGAIFSTSEEIKSFTQKIAAGNYEVPSSVYKISPPDIESLAASLGMPDFYSGLSETLLEQINHQASSVAVSQLTASEGTVALAASSIYRANKVFVCQELEADCIYLYLFDQGYPVAVTFTVGENGAVSATGSFVICEELQNASADEIPELLNTLFPLLGCKAEKLP
ncbi:MAG: hypothetical protein HFE84_01115 [Lachnospiraceae bacterium]|nr:hypothetical protein [Lachnospiraceae bacterium]